MKRNRNQNELVGIGFLCVVLAILLLFHFFFVQHNVVGQYLNQGITGTIQQVTGSSPSQQPSGKQLAYYTNEIPEGTENPVRIQFIDIGQGLSVLIGKGDSYAIYDGGGRNTASYLVSYLKNIGVQNIRYMFASHYDEDHIGGLVGVLNTINTENIVCPDYTAKTRIYTSFVSAAQDSLAQVIHPALYDTFEMDGVSFQVIGPTETYEEENNKSLVVKVSYGDFVCILTGDAEQEEESGMVRSGTDLKANILSVGHHGSSSSSTAEFIGSVSSQLAVISCGENNDYGHPTQKTLDTLEKNGASIRRTDLDGTVSIATDGSVWWLEAA